MKGHNAVELITVIAEAVLEKALASDIERLGAHGYTISDVRGKGSRGYRGAEWRESANIKLEILCDAQVAKALVEHIKSQYFEDYGVVLYTSEVQVLRSEKF